jgi:hypothetical protein
MVDRLKKRSDLDTLFELHCRYQNLPAEQRANPSDLTVDSKANELWRALQMPLEYSESPWDPNWQPPFEGSPFEITPEFHATVCLAIFRVPFFDFVKYTLGYNMKAHSLVSLLHTVCDIRDSLRTAFQDRPMTRAFILKSRRLVNTEIHRDKGYYNRFYLSIDSNSWKGFGFLALIGHRRHVP